MYMYCLAPPGVSAGQVSREQRAVAGQVIRKQLAAAAGPGNQEHWEPPSLGTGGLTPTPTDTPTPTTSPSLIPTPPTPPTLPPSPSSHCPGNEPEDAVDRTLCLIQ